MHLIPIPVEAKQPQIMTDPPSCFTVGRVPFSSKVLFFFSSHILMIHWAIKFIFYFITPKDSIPEFLWLAQVILSILETTFLVFAGQ